MGIIMLLSFFHVVAMAFSDESAVRLQQVAFWPVGFNVAENGINPPPRIGISHHKRHLLGVWHTEYLR